jgi:hypothetical protein
MSRIEKNWKEASKIAHQFFNDKHMLTVAMVQFAEREKIRVLNQERKKHGEPLIDVTAESSRWPGGHDFEWIIDPPQPFYNDIDKPFRAAPVSNVGDKD